MRNIKALNTQQASRFVAGKHFCPYQIFISNDRSWVSWEASVCKSQAHKTQNKLVCLYLKIFLASSNILIFVSYNRICASQVVISESYKLAKHTKS
jgi:hypothetical protein